MRLETKAFFAVAIIFILIAVVSQFKTLLTVQQKTNLRDESSIESMLMLHNFTRKRNSPACPNRTFPSDGLKLADNCYHVFIDVGANLGMHSRFLFEPSKYPDSTFAQAIFSNNFGKQRHSSDICVFAFEPNPIHKARFKEFSESYNKMGWRVNFINAGVSDVAGNLSFYHVDVDPNKGKEVGFTSVKSKCKATGRCSEEVVPVVRLADWLQKEILFRRLPTSTLGLYKEGPKVVMKLDVEL